MCSFGSAPGCGHGDWTAHINAVVVNGRLLDRKALDALLEQVENAARKD